mmetsp:Transcript_12942/g.32614  ORF Transcript_12942/g.32614 Transcript_12942/m.32614 type:complete len:262 (+) Transcript_12942:624-1409(+)
MKLQAVALAVELDAVTVLRRHARVHDPRQVHVVGGVAEAKLRAEVVGRDVGGALGAAPLLDQVIGAVEGRRGQPREELPVRGGQLPLALGGAVPPGAVAEGVLAHKALLPRRAVAREEILGAADCDVPPHDDRVPEPRGPPVEAQHVAHQHEVHVLVQLVGVEVEDVPHAPGLLPHGAAQHPPALIRIRGEGAVRARVAGEVGGAHGDVELPQEALRRRGGRHVDRRDVRASVRHALAVSRVPAVALGEGRLVVLPRDVPG